MEVTADEEGGGKDSSSASTTARKRRRRLGAGRGSESPLYEVVCPAVYVIRVFGLAPYAYPKDNRPPRLSPSAFNCVFSLFWMTLYTYIVVGTMRRFNGLNKEKPILGVTENGKLILNYLVLMSHIILNFFARARMTRVWNNIQDFDEAHNLGAPPPPGSKQRYNAMLSQTRFWIWLGLTFWCFGWATVNQLGMFAFNEPYLQNVGYLLTYAGSCVGVLKFCGLIYLLGQRFRYLNEQVDRQLEVRGEQFDLVKANAVIKKIEASHDQLMSTSELLSDAYYWSLFLFLVNLFCHAVCNFYFFTIWTIVDPSYLSNNLKIVSCLASWLLMYLVQLVLLHVSCQFVSYQANRMCNKLLDWRRHADRQSKQNNFCSTLHYLNRKLNFTAAGCFDVNLPLLTSAVGHMTTYLIILLQLPNQTDSPDD